MSKPTVLFAAFAPLALTWLAVPVAAQTREETTVRTATAVINEIMAIPAWQIPKSLLVNAQGIAIIPDVVKIGLIGGVRHGRGVLVLRDAGGRWTAPTFVTLTGGSVGWQVGVQATDLVLVLNTRRSIEGLRRGKFTIGVDASAAAGPVGRKAGVATDARLQAEILTYSRSRGLFAGVSIDGSALQIDAAATAAYYQSSGAALGPGAIPPSAADLVRTVTLHSSPTGVAPVQFVAPVAGPAAGSLSPTTTPPVAATGTASDPLRQQLAGAATRLSAVLDPRWRQFLALPTAVFSGTSDPGSDALNQALASYERVARDPQYRDLAARPEFQATLDLLRRYAASKSPRRPGTLTLPPPPADASSHR